MGIYTLICVEAGGCGQKANALVGFSVEYVRFETGRSHLSDGNHRDYPPAGRLTSLG